MTLTQITNYLEDDWDDNALTNRTGSTEGYFLHPSDGLLSGDVEAGDALKGVYRPEWNTITSGWTATNGRLEDANSTCNIETPTNFFVGRWSMDFQLAADGGEGDNLEINFLYSDNNNRVFNNVEDSDSAKFNIQTVKGGSFGNVINSNWTVDTGTLHTTEITRDSYGNFELLLDGVSNGTATETFTVSDPSVSVRKFDAGGTGTTFYVENVVVK